MSSSGKQCLLCLRQNALVVLTIAGVVIGVVLGIALRESPLSRIEIAYFSFPGELLLRMLKMIILPLIICSLITGVLNKVILGGNHAYCYVTYDCMLLSLLKIQLSGAFQTLRYFLKWV